MTSIIRRYTHASFSLLMIKSYRLMLVHNCWRMHACSVYAVMNDVISNGEYQHCINYYYTMSCNYRLRNVVISAMYS